VNKWKYDFYIGLVAIMAIAGALLKSGKIIDFLLLVIFYEIAIQLWVNKLKIAKFVGFLLLPMLIFSQFLPKRVKQILQEIEQLELQNKGE
jgi:hypothetical protein